MPAKPASECVQSLWCLAFCGVDAPAFRKAASLSENASCFTSRLGYHCSQLSIWKSDYLKDRHEGRLHKFIERLQLNEAAADGILFFIELRECLLNIYNAEHDKKKKKKTAAEWLEAFFNVPVLASELGSDQLQTLARQRLHGMAHQIAIVLLDEHSTGRPERNQYQLRNALKKLDIDYDAATKAATCILPEVLPETSSCNTNWIENLRTHGFTDCENGGHGPTESDPTPSNVDVPGPHTPEDATGEGAAAAAHSTPVKERRLRGRQPGDTPAKAKRQRGPSGNGCAATLSD